MLHAVHICKVIGTKLFSTMIEVTVFLCRHTENVKAFRNMPTLQLSYLPT